MQQISVSNLKTVTLDHHYHYYWYNYHNYSIIYCLNMQELVRC
jgi:hypothetical protein